MLYKHPSTVLWRSIEAKVFSQLLGQVNLKGRILDLGCGDGKVSSVIFNQTIDVGLDLEIVIEKAKLTKKYEALVLGDGRCLPFKNDSFGLVASNSVIEHIPCVEKVLKEVSRVLRKQGYFIFTVPSENFGKFLFFYTLFSKLRLRRLAQHYSMKRNEYLNHYNIFPEKDWVEALRKNNLKVLITHQYLNASTIKLWDVLAVMIFILREIGIYKFGRLTGLFDKVRIKLFSKCLRKYYEQMKNDNGGAIGILAQKC